MSGSKIDNFTITSCTMGKHGGIVCDKVIVRNGICKYYKKKYNDNFTADDFVASINIGDACDTFFELIDETVKNGIKKGDYIDKNPFHEVSKVTGEIDVKYEDGLETKINLFNTTKDGKQVFFVYQKLTEACNKFNKMFS